MRRYTFFILACLFWSAAMGQQFQNKLSLALPPGITPIQTTWADINNDSLPDILVSAKKGNHISMWAFKDPKTGVSTGIALMTTPFASGTFTLCDINKDNQMDLAFSGTDTLNNPRTEIYLNSGSFIYTIQNQPVPLPVGTPLAFSDLNNDAQTDLILIRPTGALSVFRNHNNAFELVFDSAGFSAKDFSIADFDGNGFKDIAISLVNQAHQPELMIIEFANGFDVLRTIRIPFIRGKMDAGDLDHDGQFDLVISGENSVGQLITRAYINHDSTFVAGQLLPGIMNPSLRIGDFDSDGGADIVLQGRDASNNLFNSLFTFAGATVPLPTDRLLFQSFCDFDRDGDLDIAQVTDTLSIVVVENTIGSTNAKPAKPGTSFGTFVFNRLFLYWPTASDDKTPVKALTYDLFLESPSSPIIPSEYETKTLYRLTVSNGNQGESNSSLLRVPVGSYGFKVQTVDNAFVGSGLCFGQCNGSPCAEAKDSVINVCKPKPFKLSEPEPALWFSFNKGFLGIADSMTMDSESDTVFSFRPQNGATCNSIRTYRIAPSPADTFLLSHTQFLCSDSTANLLVDDQWMDVVWRDAAGAVKGTGNTLQYKPAKTEQIIATANTPQGCQLVQTENLHISKPALTVEGDAYTIIKGESVTLHASGAESYSWQPPQGLNNLTVSDPVASPQETTTYTVIGYDSLHCSATAKITVDVESAAFVPNLFTPNGDGKNDELKIYGLSAAREFHFSIHNREGNIVYDSHDISATASRGWDGLRNGEQQPPGLYYWKIEGSYDNGSPLHLNGKTKGSILLVR